MNNKVVIGGNLKLKNVVSGQAKLNNVISGTPNTSIRAGGRGGISNAVKEALLDCFEHVAWIDDDGQVYYQALYDALYAKVLTSITAVFEQGQAVIYDDDTLDDLKQYLTVTANYDDGTSAVITTYMLSGTLNPGTSSIQVSYENKKAYFNVTVTHRPGVVTITNTLNGCTTSNSATSMTEGDPYTATITASAGYVLTGATVSITMNGVDITASAYSNGTISIAEVTGSLVITITAVAVTLASISALYTQSSTVYEDTALNDLKTDLVVTALYSDSSTATVPSTDYTLSGTLTVGTSTVTVSYGEKTTTFNVTVSQSAVPSGYTRYDYILAPKTISSIAQNKHIKLKSYSNLNALSAEFWYKTASSGIDSNGSAVFGGRTANNSTYSFAFYAKKGTLAMHAHGTDVGYQQTTSTSDVNHVVYTNTNASPSSYYVNENTPSSFTWNNTDAISDMTPAVSANLIKNSSSKLSGGIQIGDIKFYDLNGNLLSWYTPVVRNSDNVMGMFEIVDQIFYTSVDATSTTIGSESALFTVGNWS